MAGESVILAGSFLPPLDGVQSAGAPAVGMEIEVSVWLRRKPSAPAPVPNPDKLVERTAFAKTWGADERDVKLLVDHLRSVDPKIERLKEKSEFPDLAKRLIGFKGQVASFEKAFGVTVEVVILPSGERILVRTGHIFLPSKLENIVLGVFGLDERPIGSREYPEEAVDTVMALATVPTPPQIADLYKFPNVASAKGQSIAIMEFGGGYLATDTNRYFQNLGVKPPYKLEAVSVAGGSNNPGTNPVYDLEVTLDIEIVGAIAPEASLYVYFAPHTERGWIEAIASAVHDQVRNPLNMSISWGAPELGTSNTLTWSRSGMDALREQFLDAACLGMNVFASSGNDGSNCNVNDRRAHVSYPASDPHVIGCGGTRIANYAARPNEEVAWAYGGGGVSDVFPVPTSFQAPNKLPRSVNDGGNRRGVPDISGYASPGYVFWINGNATRTAIPGTSLVAPFYAAIVARMNVYHGHTFYYILPNLYGLATIRDIDDPLSNSTSNGQGWAAGYYGRKGWDGRTGLGVWVGGAKWASARPDR